MKAVEYLAAVKAKRNITSDYKLSKALGISTQMASKYANGQNIPGPIVAFRIAEILGEQPAAVIADFELERAERDKKEDEADEWKGFVKKLGGAAASILLVMGLGGISNADARLVNQVNPETIYTSYRWKKKARWLDGLLPPSIAFA